MCYLHLPPYCEGLLHNIAPILCVKFQYVKRCSSLRLNKSFSRVISFRRIVPLIAHVLAYKTSTDIGIFEVIYQLRMRILTCTLCSQILQQLAQIGVSGVTVGRALQQLSQRTEVLLHNVSAEKTRMHTHRYVLYKVLFCILNFSQDRYLTK
jgi:hypothetical protein